jgi:predicted metalloendopeptidase
MFFLSVGHVWCSKSTPESLVSQIADDEHANNKFRILGPLQNSPEFSQAFNCAPKTKMNPEKKCSLW